MRIKTIQLKDFKRFHDLKIDLGDNPKKIIALVGPNGSGKSSVFDAFEEFSADQKGITSKRATYYKKSIFEEGNTDKRYDRRQQVTITSDQTAYTNTSFYIRSAYRFTSRLEVEQIKKLSNVESDEKRPRYLIDVDARLVDNYERLLGSFHDDVFDKDITGKAWAQTNIDGINTVLEAVLDIKISSLGNPVKSEGSLYFEKGVSKKFPYENLSAGEKEVVDIVLDIYVKRNVYTNSVICIDEPELHLNTAIQRKLLIEIEKLIPEDCQLWIATHSLGFLRALQEDLKDKTSVVDFTNNDFDTAIELKPVAGSRKDWMRIFQTALEDLTGLLSPGVIIYCEGKVDPTPSGDDQGLDAEVYNQIFSIEYPHALFISSGGSTQPDKYASIALTVLNKAFTKVDILLLKDMDINGDGTPTTSAQRGDFLAAGTKNRMLDRKEIENFLFDFEIITKAYPGLSKADYDAIVPDIMNDVKSKAAQLMIAFGIHTGMNRDQFKIHLAKFVTPDTNIYTQLKTIIFG